ncbi:MAG: NADH-quinone oxidoreductase subunit G [Alphaproteobacteria bacterium]|nr:NADH-quinone oxidoreductase subunit G [Alphaproteobacteria bacterium]OJV12492.1 MAG: NADH-quinone oxidoreductase subunit G [Alphaproteobacteria bacterium 33-17]
MPKITIDGKEIEVAAGLTVIQACEIAGIEIPRFCYHDKLSIAGNCRMCLVEMEKAPKPVASCAMPVNDGMVIKTDTPTVKKAREGVMEFLLINHPLDCPICDQGGECDLQDQAMAYGKCGSRFHENKRAVTDKYMGPLIKTHMTRCIHCTRCIRFIDQIAGVPDLGATGRGEHMEVGTYVEKAVSSEISGNIIDLCPVGALTSKPYAFKARSWELRKVESIDVLDAVGSNIRVDYRGLEVMRILPRINEEINEEWISDKTRFAYDGLKYQRLDRPMLKENSKFKEASWEDAYAAVKNLLNTHKPSEIGFIAGDLADGESIYLMKRIADDLNIKNIDGVKGLKYKFNNRFSYLFNTTIQGLEKADVVLFVGSNPRYEASMVGARLRKTYRKNHTYFASIGKIDDQTYPVEHLGDNANILKDILAGEHEFAEKLQNAKNPVIIVGEAIFAREDSYSVQKVLSDICEKFNINRDDHKGYNVLHKAASRVASLDLGFVPENGMNAYQMIEAAKSGDIKVLYLLGADEFALSGISDKCKIIYQGHHGDNGAKHSHVVLPGSAYTEKNAIYLNMEGRVQQTKMAVAPLNMAKPDYQILSEVIENIGRITAPKNLKELRSEIYAKHPHFAKIDEILSENFVAFGSAGDINNSTINTICDNFFMTDPISRSSRTMAECAKLFKNKDEEAA